MADGSTSTTLMATPPPAIATCTATGRTWCPTARPTSGVSPRFHSYRERNGYKLPATHRLDVAASYHLSHDTGESTISLSICNLYNRQNVSDVYIGYDNNQTVLKGVCMFPFMPSLSYRFKF